VQTSASCERALNAADLHKDARSGEHPLTLQQGEQTLAVLIKAPLIFAQQIQRGLGLGRVVFLLFQCDKLSLMRSEYPFPFNYLEFYSPQLV
jgi:hypothetical protein